MAPVIYKAGRTSDCSDAFPKPAAIVAVIGRMDSVGSCGKELFPPARMTTIIVSPMARAIPSITAAAIPEIAAGIITHQIAWSLLQPSA